MGLPEAGSSTSASLGERRRDSSHQNQSHQVTASLRWGEPLRQLPRPQPRPQPLPLTLPLTPQLPLRPRPRPVLPMEHLREKARNCVNVHGNTLRLEVDEQDLDYHLISFGFDAPCNGRFTILYSAKKELNYKFLPPVKVPFQKGPGQKFRQPSGTGIDLGFFKFEELSTPSAGDVFRLVIFAETFVPSSSRCTQVIKAVIDKNNDKNAFDVRVIEQTFWIDGFLFKWEEIYGIANSTAGSFKDEDPGKVCVICMTGPKDTIVLPCLHMEMCGECLERWKLENNTCPLCREPIEKLVSINNIYQC